MRYGRHSARAGRHRRRGRVPGTRVPSASTDTPPSRLVGTTLYADRLNSSSLSARPDEQPLQTSGSARWDWRVTTAHRQGYHKYGQPIAAGYDPSPEARDRFAADAPEARVYDTVEALLADPEVGVIDVATPHHRSDPSAGDRSRSPRPASPDAHPEAVRVHLRLTPLEIGDGDRSGGRGADGQPEHVLHPWLVAAHRRRDDGCVVGEPSFAQVSVQYRFDLRTSTRGSARTTGGGPARSPFTTSVCFSCCSAALRVGLRGYRSRRLTARRHHRRIRASAAALSVRQSVAVTSTGTYYGTDPIPHGNEKLWVQGRKGSSTGGPKAACRSLGGAAPIRRQARRVGCRTPVVPGCVRADHGALPPSRSPQAEPLCSVTDNLHVMAVIEAAYRSSDRESRRAAGGDHGIPLRTRSTAPAGLTAYNEWAPPQLVEVTA